VAAGFFNAIAPVDIAVVNSGFGEVRAFPGLPGSEADFSSAAPLLRSIDLTSGAEWIAHAASADINGDGHDDILTINDSTDVGVWPVSILWGRGDAAMFDPGVQIVETLPEIPARYVFPAKLQSGGSAAQTDMIIIGEQYVTTLLGNASQAADGQNLIDTPLPADFHATSGCIGDINGDATPELIIIDTGASELIIATYGGGGTWDFNEDPPDPDVGFRWSLPFQSFPRACATGDLNDDGNDEVLVTQWNPEGCDYSLDPNVCPWNTMILLDAETSQAPTGFDLEIGYPVGKLPWDIEILDMDGDGNLDAVTANAATGDVSIIHGDGTGWFSGETRIDTGAAGGTPAIMEIEDLNADGVQDFVITRPDNKAVSIVISTG
jgi:hypothetical protein